MKVGISTVLFHSDIVNINVYSDIFPVLRKLKELGYKFIQMNTRSLPNPFSPSQQKKKIL